MPKPPLPCDQLSCTGVIECLWCRTCSEHCECQEDYDRTPWETPDSGSQRPSAEERAEWQRLK